MRIQRRQRSRSKSPMRPLPPIFRAKYRENPSGWRSQRRENREQKTKRMNSSGGGGLVPRSFNFEFSQLDLVTPGIMPAEASSRKVRRETLKRRINARRRPLTWH